MQVTDLSIQRTVWNARTVSVCFALIVLLAISVAPALGQTDTGSIVGIVQDPTHAVVIGAQVDIINTATNVTRSFVTNTEDRKSTRLNSSHRIRSRMPSSA